MNLKKLWLSGVLFCGIMHADQVYKTTWLSGVAELDAIESLKYDIFCGEFRDLCKNAFDEKFCESMKPCLAKWSKKYEQHASSVENAEKNSKKNKKQIKQITKKLQQDKELTLLVKNLVEAFDAYFSDCIDVQDSAHQQLLKAMAHYFPETVDINQVHLDYMLWVYEYLQTRLSKKDILKVDDLSYVMKQFPFYIKQHIPFSTLFSLKKSYEMWMGLVHALEKGLNDQPKDVQRYFIEKLEKFIKDPELKICFDSITSMNQKRGEIIKSASKGKTIDKAKLKEYEKLLDVSIVHVNKIVGQHVGKKNPEKKFFVMTEKLLFVS